MQKAGFDLQINGFGLMSTYHANNEHCLLSDMKKAFSILLKCISLLNATDWDYATPRPEGITPRPV